MAARQLRFAISGTSFYTGARIVRRAQRAERSFGDVPTCAWEAFREVIPWQADPASRPPNPGELAYEFLRDNEPVACLGDLSGAPKFPKGKGPKG